MNILENPSCVAYRYGIHTAPYYRYPFHCSLFYPSRTARARPFDPFVFTNDAYIQRAALKAGALHAGGDTSVDQLLQGEVSVESFDHAVGEFRYDAHPFQNGVCAQSSRTRLRLF
jgi:hypothetical protein